MAIRGKSVRRTAPAKPTAARKVAPKRGPGVERRQAKRLDVLWQLNVEVLSHPMPVSASDISSTGFSIETTAPFQDGEVHEFRFTLDGGASAVMFAESTHCVPNERVGALQFYLTGFKFVQMDAATRQSLKTLIAQIQQYLALA